MDLEPTRANLDLVWQIQSAVNAFTDILGRKTQRLAKDEFRRSPFSVSAAQAGYAHIGGKLDDITAVVAVVSTGEPMTAADAKL